MDWIEIRVRADGEGAEAVSELFNRLNSRADGQDGAVTEVSGFDPVGEDHRPFVTVCTYLPAGLPDAADRQRQIEEGLWHLGRIHPLGETTIRRLAEEDWANAWKSHYHPLRIGRRFLVVPAWQVAETAYERDDLRIILDPGMAFGTGLHPSTQLCLRALESVAVSGRTVLDAGCGSGILSIGAGRLGAAEIDAFDIDPLAVEATKANVALNDLPVAVSVEISSGPGDAGVWSSRSGQPRWDVILVNILPHVIVDLLRRGLHTYLAAAGDMILAGIIHEREQDVRDALNEVALFVTSRLTEGDWVALVVKRQISGDGSGATGRFGA